MDPHRFDNVSLKLSRVLSRRGLAGGALGASLLAALGLDEAGARQQPDDGDEVGAEACIPTGKKCPSVKPRGRRGRRRRRRRPAKVLGCDQCCQGHFETVTTKRGRTRTKCTCLKDGLACNQNFECCTGVCGRGVCGASSGPVTRQLAEEGSGTLTAASPAGCDTTPEGCTNAVAGVVTGTPINGAFSGTLTTSNYAAGDPGTQTADLNGTILMQGGVAADTLTLTITGSVVITEASGAFTFSGSFVIVSGTGQYSGATGEGTATGAGTGIGVNGTLDSLTLNGTITLP